MQDLFQALSKEQEICLVNLPGWKEVLWFSQPVLEKKSNFLPLAKAAMKSEMWTKP